MKKFISKLLCSLLNFRKIYYLYVELVGFLLRHRAREGIEVIEEDWKNLIVLDACRFDKFKKINSIEGKLKKVASKGTATPQWLKRNFKDYYEDIVYVSGNPYLSKLAHEDQYFDAEKHFFHVEHVWDYGWNEELNTTPPDEINKVVIRLKEKYPDKKFIIHYMQPHVPFIGDIRDIKTNKSGWAGSREQWVKKETEKAYEQNLKVALSHVKKLIPKLEDRIVITSDHGEILEGSYGFRAHPKDIFIRQLREVPWFIVEK